MRAQNDYHSSSSSLQQPDWSKVRPIYKKLSDEFHVLLDAYGIQLDEHILLMLDHLILGIDEVDRSIDALPTRDERDDLTQSILNYLGNQKRDWNHNLATTSLTANIVQLKSMIQELHIEQRFIQAATKIFHYTEIKRHTTNMKKLFEFIQLEGQATAELPLSFMNIAATAPFGKFFTQLCTLMGIADLVVDAKRDYASNYIVLRPSFRLYIQLLLLVVRKGTSLVWNFPRPLSFIRYSTHFLYLLLISEE